MGHIHAELMAQYAEDALETDKPWERWEFSHDDRDFLPLASHPQWIIDNKYRRKAKTILINGYEVPEPCRTPLDIDDVYWTFIFFAEEGVIQFDWADNSKDNSCLRNGVIHLTKEAAEKHFNALRSFTAKDEQ